MDTSSPEQQRQNITLEKAGLKSEIDPDGAWINSLEINGVEILTPRHIRAEDGKERGGMHICLPQFGPTEQFGLEQHGIGRKIEWQVQNMGVNSVILELPRQEGYEDYPDGLEARLEYSINSTDAHVVLRASLGVLNSGIEDIPIAPAFHPYFDLNGGIEIKSVELGTFDDLTEDEAGTMRVVDGPVLFTQGGSPVGMSTSPNLRHYYFWTDRKDEYLCIEPTSYGPGFDDPDKRLKLKSGDTEQYTFEIVIPLLSERKAA